MSFRDMRTEAATDINIVLRTMYGYDFTVKKIKFCEICYGKIYFFWYTGIILIMSTIPGGIEYGYK